MLCSCTFCYVHVRLRRINFKVYFHFFRQPEKTLVIQLDKHSRTITLDLPSSVTKEGSYFRDEIIARLFHDVEITRKQGQELTKTTQREFDALIVRYGFTHMDRSDPQDELDAMSWDG